MKRIGLLVLLVIAASGLHMAAEPKIKYDLRTSGNLATVDFDESDNSKGALFGLNDYFGAEIADDNAGAKVMFKGNIADSTTKIDEYFGWVKLGSVKLTAGEFDNRWMNRVKNEESSWVVWEKFKYGALKNGALVKESENIAVWGKNDLVAEYTAGNLLLAASCGTEDTAVDKALNEVFAGRVAYTLPDTARLSGAFSMYAEDRATAGLFAELLTIKDLSLVAGYSGAYDLEESEANVSALELRARYVTGPWAATSHNNASFGKDTVTVYTMVNVARKFTDVMSANLYANNVNVSGSAAKDAAADGNTLTMRPGMTFTAQKNTTLDIGFEFSFAKINEADMVSKMSIPCVVRVRL